MLQRGITSWPWKKLLYMVLHVSWVSGSKESWFVIVVAPCVTKLGFRESFALTRAGHARSDPSSFPNAHGSEKPVHVVSICTGVGQLHTKREDACSFGPIMISVWDHWRVPALPCNGKWSCAAVSICLARNCGHKESKVQKLNFHWDLCTNWKFGCECDHIG